MFKDKIKELRVNNDLSLVQFAEMIGISKTTVSLYEAGRQNPGRKTIAKICETFDVTEEWLLGEDAVPAGEKEVKNPPKKTAVSNTKGENKMSKKNRNSFVPPLPFAPYARSMGKTEEQDDARKAKVDEMKENYKELLKKYRQEDIDAGKNSAQKRKDKREQAFDRFMEMQETFADYMSDNLFVLPFAPMYSISPKKMMKQFMEIERLSDEFLRKQAEIYADFREQRKNLFRDMMAAAVTKNTESDAKDEAEEKD